MGTVGRCSEPLEARPSHLGGAVDQPVRSYQGIFPTGGSGDPALATIETGERPYAIAADWCARVILRAFGPQ